MNRVRKRYEYVEKRVWKNKLFFQSFNLDSDIEFSEQNTQDTKRKKGVKKTSVLNNFRKQLAAAFSDRASHGMLGKPKLAPHLARRGL